MAKAKSHLLYTKAPEGTATFKYSKRGGGSIKEEDEEEHVKIQPVNLSANVKKFRNEYTVRRAERNKKLQISEEVICIDIKFWGWFNSSEFEIKYRSQFGLSPLKYSEYNTRVLFAVVDMSLFRDFIKQIEKYSAFQEGNLTTYNPNVKFIRDFHFHNTTDR
jgi:hypothetical protein